VSVLRKSRNQDKYIERNYRRDYKWFLHFLNWRYVLFQDNHLHIIVLKHISLTWFKSTRRFHRLLAARGVSFIFKK